MILQKKRDRRAAPYRTGLQMIREGWFFEIVKKCSAGKVVSCWKIYSEPNAIPEAYLLLLRSLPDLRSLLLLRSGPL